MNKGIWHYQIDKLFTMYEVSFPDMHIDTVIAADHVNMGDSANVNRGRNWDMYLIGMILPRIIS